MSIIFITQHDEVIYNLAQSTETEKKKEVKSPTKQQTPHLKKSAKYPIQYPEIKPIKRATATMGVPQESHPNPAEYLKKGNGKMCYSLEETVKDGFHPKHVCQKKEKVFPTQEEIEQYRKKKKEEQKEDKNFVIKNIKKVLAMKVKEPERKMVIDRYGVSKPMSAGLEPMYITQDLVGKTPSYLKKFIKQKEIARQMMRDTVGVERPKCKYITREEREKLLTGLKHNWEELQTQYQGLPILTDTIPKKHRKSKLETELRQLEKDIVLMERHPYIYVYDDNATFN